jgi:NAD(P)-dependent dehydrogenase (short-subunit alcohol dehydrogenase family)
VSPEDRWCVVLGASIGSGAAIARALARDPGLHLFGVHRGRHPDEAAAVEAAVRAEGRQVHWHIADAGSAEAAGRGAEAFAAAAGAGRVQVFVHSVANASVGRFTSAAGDPFQPWQFTKTFESMAHSFVHWIEALLSRGLLAPGARLIGLSNPLVHTPLDGCGLIAATKAALEVYVRYLAVELGPLGYRVNLLTYGAAETKALHVVLDRKDRATAVREALRHSTPAKRLVTLEQVGAFVSVLAGEAGAWFNGANIDMTGGEALGHYNALVEAVREREDA